MSESPQRPPILIRPLQPADWPAVRDIYAEGIATGLATFETEVPDWASWDRDHRPDCRLVAVESGVVAGWAALCFVSRRPAYAGVAEVSVYVRASHRGRRVGRALLRALVDASEEAGVWTLQGVIFPENEASLRLHESCGFRVVGRRERVGRLGNAWRDTLLMERRSDR